ncbi:MAG: YraN family protein [Chloroflexi bacterium]|nr:MAG: YraN family protein [Chloroflexota bacterium]
MGFRRPQGIRHPVASRRDPTTRPKPDSQDVLGTVSRLRAGRPAELGRAGEKAAADLLRSRGYQIVGAGFLARRGELDLVCRRGRDLVVVEVKTRRRRLSTSASRSANWSGAARFATRSWLSPWPRMAPWTPGCSKIPSTELLPPVTIELGRVLHADGVGVGQQPVVEALGPTRPLRRDEQLLHQTLELWLVEHHVVDQASDELGRPQRRSRRHVHEPRMPADGDRDRLDHLAVIDDVRSGCVDRHVVRLLGRPRRDLRDVFAGDRLDAVITSSRNAEDREPPEQPCDVVDQDVPVAEDQRRSDDRPGQS